ncbi:MAG: HAMP domain-containing protein [Candidatus Omnitrophica bacterium]|nr:HAMP domain-containing protein [Candidatus Omnitrophota bacterium]
MRRDEDITLSLRAKTAILVFLITLFMVALPVTVLMFAGMDRARNEIYKRYETITAMLAGHIGETLDEELLDTKVLLSSFMFINEAEGANASYAGMKDADMPGFFADMDRMWSEKELVNDKLKRILDTGASKELADLTKTLADIREIFLTDRYGGLVAASGKTSDFYQADEEWWQEAFNGGKGASYVGKVEYDESIRSMSIPLAVPIKSADGSVIGVCKNVVAVGKVMESLEKFRYGKTGFAFLIDEKAEVLFAPSFFPKGKKFVSGENVKKIYFKETGTIVMLDEKDIKVFALVKNPVLAKKGIRWIVVFEQDKDEIYSPLKSYFRIALFLMALTIVISALASRYVGGVLSQPVESIVRAVGKIAEGDLDHPVRVDTGDELQVLAEVTNDMAAKLKRSRQEMLGYSARLESEVKARTSELEELKVKLENEVDERAGELREKNEDLLLDQKAMLFMIEDLNKQADELREAYDRIGKSERLAALGELSGMLGHELRNPLSAILTSVYFLRMKKDVFASDPMVLKHVGMIESEAKRSNGIITNILSFASPKLPILKRVIVHDIVKEVIITKAFPVPDKIRIELDSAGLAKEIMGDAGQLKQVFTNVLTNAIEAMPDGGKINVTGHEDGANVVVAVKDEGVGIPEENIEKIFQPLFTGKPRGTGLGLSVTSKIMKAHKGSIEVESVEGKGTTMILKFPAAIGARDLINLDNIP